MSQMLHVRKQLLKLTQAELAAIAKVSQATVSRWETGLMEPSRTELALIREEARRQGLTWDDTVFFDPLPAEAAA